MAKATRSEGGNTPRPRGARATLSTSTPFDAPADAPAAETEDDPQDALSDGENDAMARMDEADYAADEGDEGVGDEDESLRLGPRDVATTSADDLLYSRPGTRVTARNLVVPAWANSNPITRFIAESVIELLKVTWPTRDEAWNMTLVVIVMSAIVGLVLGAADLGLQHVLVWIVNVGK